MSYQDVKDKLYQGHRKIANNTKLTLEEDWRGGENIVMRLHGNYVAAFYPDHIELHSAGWHTATTKDRLNLALKLAHIYGKVSQYKRQWYLDTNILDTVLLEDGVKIAYNGYMLKT